MRFAVAVAFVLLMVPSQSSADTILNIEYENSRMEFGAFGARYEGQNSYFVELVVDGLETSFPCLCYDFDAISGPLLSRTTEIDSFGLTRDTSIYDGGTLDISGSFVAPIVGPFVVSIRGGTVEVAFKFGEGIFDPWVTGGGPRRIVGGEMEDLFLDLDTPLDAVVIRASEGAPIVTMHVPEPGALLLMIASGLAFSTRQWRRRRSAP